MMLCVNVDHVATVREARKTFEPDPVVAATLAILGGADGITVHLREDRRHINDRDLRLLRGVVPHELNLEMAATEEMIRIATDVKPDMVTLVPEKREELTTEGGMDMLAQKEHLRKAVKKINDAGIPVSLFINPEIIDVDVSKEIGADMVEIHTGFYSNLRGKKQEGELHRIINAVKFANKVGLMTNAGHGLNYFNIKGIASIEGIRGLYIGHSIISRAVLSGIEKAVMEMKDLIHKASLGKRAIEYPSALMQKL
ncbi:pyridoxine 5'-phosphate synthase [Thermodesulfovibrionales bacterium]|nr:pyridoxine 5'-phosphate synthase [Thermodesulfovibrionales bacterium]MCL0042092.1 pyridoxine 5'-phosphate synthase [Thermodesulfovibrionales bacterium]MCL0049896.1 pyridoxine 5'-phosphate synthase [Thermodesulfovibrionales bacterium]MCL0051109.1 pyridoxine 5'-phosphate synthase [Thermodesulfovibrionales bacterium]MCL0082929.1 pyridoxine 5'-phosphate synthase [Thermodesulfovibrionales bacterium]